ncbi:MAG: hypothetical protein K2V38_16290 [Gemmataceae bacterium]|nr:hypothetical protein [Gemmataceae bacterium]
MVESSHLDGVTWDTAMRLLTERAVLTRAVCREVTEAGDGFGGRRQCIALSFLLRWIVENLPESLQYRAASGNLCRDEPRASHGIDLMLVPDGCEGVLQEIRDGAEVGDALRMLMTADNHLQARGDEAVIRERLATYWARHGTAVRTPSACEYPSPGDGGYGPVAPPDAAT